MINKKKLLVSEGRLWEDYGRLWVIHGPMEVTISGEYRIRKNKYTSYIVRRILKSTVMSGHA